VNPPAAKPEFALRARADEARLIAELLRVSRLTILCSAPGAGRTTILRHDVLRLLGRRAEDRCLAERGGGVVVPFPERRAAHEQPTEVALFFDAWGDAPLIDLQTRIASALIVRRLRVHPPFPPLAECLAAWSRQLHVRFLFIFDRFEQIASASRSSPAVAAFDDALVAIVNSPVPVNVLVSIRDDALPLLDRYRERIPTFGDASVRLPRFDRAPGASPATGAATFAQVLPFPGMTGRASEPRSESQQAGAERAWDLGGERPLDHASLAALRAWDEARPDTGASPDEALDVLREWSRDAAGSVQALPAGDPETPSHPAPDGDRDDPRGAAAVLEHPIDPPAGRTEGDKARRRRAFSIALAAGIAVAVAVGARYVVTAEHAKVQATSPLAEPADAIAVAAPSAPPPNVEAAAAAAAAPPIASSPAPVAQPASGFSIHVDASHDTDAAIAREIAAVASRAGLELHVRSGNAPPAGPSVAIASFDTLRPPAGARWIAGSSDSGRAILMPLYTEEVHVLVRRDSPLRYLHQIDNARIDVGPPGTGSHVTAKRLYVRLFGSELPASRTSELEPQEALRRLVRDRAVDAIVVVQAQPVAWLASLAPEDAALVRLLAVDPKHPASARAIEDSLPMRLRATGYRWLDNDVQTLATMAFLVARRDGLDATAPDVTRLLSTLCAGLPELRAGGHRKWREVQPRLYIEGGWQLWPAARDAIGGCDATQVAQRSVSSNSSKPGARR
jgi:hypothetical protein